MVPTSVLKDFLEKAKAELESIQIERSLSPSMIRGLLLERQTAVLELVVADHNKSKASPLLTVQAVQGDLKNINGDSSLGRLSHDMNEAARLAYARLVLYSACRKQSEQSLREQMALKASGTIERKDLMDLFALCQTAVRLPFVQEHVTCGMKLFRDIEQTNDPKDTPPQKRLERIQRLFLGELGYDTEFGILEIKRIFFSASSNEFTGDQELADTFVKTMNAMQSIMVDVQASVSRFSDVDSGGVTRVVAVDFSEKDDETPLGQRMPEQNEEEQRQQLHVASQAAALQQQILNELMSMSEEDRKLKLAEAARVSNDVLERVMKKPPGPERVEVLRAIDEPTQRLMAMHKLWEAFEANKGRDHKNT